MKKGLSILLIATILFGGGYFYYIAQAVCPNQISYSIGTIDEKFGHSREEIRLALSEAESLWEDATGRNLFTYEENGKLKINFVYDDRQKFVNAENEFKDKLDAVENISDAISETYAELVTRYNDLRVSYEDKVAVYERKLSAYNSEVARYNQEGGAPEDVYRSLQERKNKLDKEQDELNELSSELNGLVAEINNIGEKGNTIIDSYNAGVNTYNKTFGESHEFTQGDYADGVIQIYSFDSKEELQIVLAHELGHALSLDHTKDERSIMYYLIGGQSLNTTISDADLAEFNRVCGDQTLLGKLKLRLFS